MRRVSLRLRLTELVKLRVRVELFGSDVRRRFGFWLVEQASEPSAEQAHGNPTGKRHEEWEEGSHYLRSSNPARKIT